MKKATIILLTVFYSVIASGINVSIHYCGGKIKEFSLNKSSNEDGCCGNKKKSKGCCDEKAAFIKIKDNHDLSNTVSLTYNHFKALDAVFPSQLFVISNGNLSFLKLKDPSPPILYDNPLYLKYKVLLI